MSSLLGWTIGFFFIAAIGLTDARYDVIQEIIEFENNICEPGKAHLDLDGCANCVCRDHGYGSACEAPRCDHTRRRPIAQRECTPFIEFTTVCHYCKCSPSGLPIGCIEKNPRCMTDILPDLEYEKLLTSDDFDPNDEYFL